MISGNAFMGVTCTMDPSPNRSIVMMMQFTLSKNLFFVNNMQGAARAAVC